MGLSITTLDLTHMHLHIHTLQQGVDKNGKTWFLFIFRCFFLISVRYEITEKGLKWTKKFENGCKKVVWPEFGRSTWKLVEIHNTQLLKSIFWNHLLNYACQICLGKTFKNKMTLKKSQGRTTAKYKVGNKYMCLSKYFLQILFTIQSPRNTELNI